MNVLRGAVLPEAYSTITLLLLVWDAPSHLWTLWLPVSCQESTGTFWLTVYHSSEAGYTCGRAVKGTTVPMNIAFGRA